MTIDKWGTYVRVVFHKVGISGRGDEIDYHAPKPYEDEGDYWDRVWTTEEDKADESLRVAICRARSKVRELAYCNEWQYFFTGTLDPSKCDRYDLPTFIKNLGYWVGNYNKKYSVKLKYLLVPEQHKDGAYHMHGLLNGVKPESLTKNKYGYLDMPYYQQRFGYISLDPIRSHEKTCNYITKYITKEQGCTNVGFGKHRYYASRGLQKSEQGAGFWCESEEFEKLGTVYWNDFVGLKMYEMKGDFENEQSALQDKLLCEGRTRV